MLQKPVNKENNSNATWNNLNSRNLAPRAANTRQPNEAFNLSSSKISGMAKNLSIEKLSQVFGTGRGMPTRNANISSNVQTGRTTPSATSSFDLNRSRRAPEATENQSSSNVNAAQINAPPTTQQQLQTIRQIQQTLQQYTKGTSPISSNDDENEPVGDLNSCMASRPYKSCNYIGRDNQPQYRGAPRSCVGNSEWDLGGSHYQQQTNSHCQQQTNRFGHQSRSELPSSRGNLLPPNLPISGSGNQEWGTISDAQQPPAKAPSSPGQAETKYGNAFKSMLSNDTEMNVLLQTLKSEEGPVTQHGSNFVNDFVQPHEKIQSSVVPTASASVTCCMNEFSIRKTPSHTTLRPSRSILLRAKYSNNSMASLCLENGEERPFRRSSSNVKFSAPTIHMVEKEIDKTMWYTKDDEQRMLIDMIRSKKRKEARRRARRMSKESSPSSSSARSSPDSARSLENNESPRSDQSAEDRSSRLDRLPAFTANHSDTKNKSRKLMGCKAEAKIVNDAVCDNSQEDFEAEKGELIVGWDSF